MSPRARGVVENPQEKHLELQTPPPIPVPVSRGPLTPWQVAGGSLSTEVWSSKDVDTRHSLGGLESLHSE